MVTFDSSLPGTPASAWESDDRFVDRPELDLEDVSGVLVVAAHPDDESLGAAGLIAEARRRGLPVTLALVTDGGVGGVAERRAGEFDAAVRKLRSSGLALGFPDGQTRENRAEITALLQPIIANLTAGTLVVAPWRGDGHRDHRVVGEVIAELAVGRRLIEYPIWMWHWGTPDSADAPWERLRRLMIDARFKQNVLAVYRSQTEGDDPILRSDFLEHFHRGVEFFIEAEATR